MAGSRSPAESDYIAVAIFCHEQARGALQLVSNPRQYRFGFKELEDYVLMLQHVYKSCAHLNGGWPRAFPKAARKAANAFMQAWGGSEGESLRHAFAHYEEALGMPGHRLRGEPDPDEPPMRSSTVRGVEVPFDSVMFITDEAGAPIHVRLLWKDYDLAGVHAALVELERQFTLILLDSNTAELRADA